MVILQKILERVRDRANVKLHHIDFAVEYLKKYGYLKEDYSLDDFLVAVRRFHDFFHIQSDNLGTDSISAMTLVRCGNPDVEHITQDATSVRKWGITTLRWYVHKYLPGLTKEQQLNIFRRSYASVSKVCNLTFVQTDNINEANLVITTSSSKADELGSPSGVLAFAELVPSPNFKGQLLMTLDAAENWSDDPSKRGIILLEPVHCHENLHHLIGGHSSVQNALLAPFYNPFVGVPQSPDDIERLQTYYGKPVTTPPPTTPIPPLPPVPVPSPTGETVIRIKGNITELSVDGYRVTKMS